MQFTPKSQYFYHITEKKWPRRKLLKPLANEQINSDNRPEEEPDIARICVSKYIYGCLSAIPFTYCGSLYIYRTEEKVKAAYVWEVCDSKITNERWIVKPTWFIKCCTITRSILDEIKHEIPFSFGCGDSRIRLLKKQKKASLIMKKVLDRHEITENVYGY